MMPIRPFTHSAALELKGARSFAIKGYSLMNKKYAHFM
jgi:hypothetical protein